MITPNLEYRIFQTELFQNLYKHYLKRALSFQNDQFPKTARSCQPFEKKTLKDRKFES